MYLFPYATAYFLIRGLDHQFPPIERERRSYARALGARRGAIGRTICHGRDPRSKGLRLDGGGAR
jgi:hypothetical protein